MILKKQHIRIFSSVVAILLAFPLPWKGFTGFYNWLSPFILMNSWFLLKSLVVLNVLGFVVLTVSFFKKRWFCRYLCPLGLGCDTISNFSKRKTGYLKKVPSFGRWLYLMSLIAALLGIPLFIILDPLAIFNGFFSVFAEKFSWLVFVSMLGLPLLLILHLFLPNLWCTKICPLGGLFDDLWWFRKVFLKKQNAKKTPLAATSRRLFLAGGAGIVAGILLPKVLLHSKRNKFKPPASLPEPFFNILCVRCGSCIKVCPANILMHDSSTGTLAWMTPELTFERGGYCHEECNLCGFVCPSGSISPFSIEAKKQIFIATVKIGLDKCLLTHQTECDRCKSVCSYKAIEIVPSETPIIMKPKANTELCVGCGACAVVCPEETITMVHLNEL
jgi:ferredoxin-type protein NapF